MVPGQLTNVCCKVGMELPRCHQTSSSRCLWLNSWRFLCRQAVQQSGTEAACYGPISQAQFLLSLGLEARLHQLLEHATDEQADALVAGCK